MAWKCPTLDLTDNFANLARKLRILDLGLPHLDSRKEWHKLVLSEIELLCGLIDDVRETGRHQLKDWRNEKW